MAPQPKKKLSRGRRHKRWAEKSVFLPNLVVCSRCGNLKISHAICASCGYYKDRLVFEPKQTTKVTKAKENK
jgi:large subunit ribosomal protein L32